MRRSFSLVPASISSVRSRSSVVVPANDHVDEMPTRDDAPPPTADAAVAARPPRNWLQLFQKCYDLES